MTAPPLHSLPTADHVIVTALACGDQISTDVRLEADLTCDAVSVIADNVTINLNGHEIVGTPTGVGITHRQRAGVIIHGGTVRNFVTGIFVERDRYLSMTGRVEEDG